MIDKTEIKKEEIQELPPCSYEGIKIEVIDSEEKLLAALDYLECQYLIGFDTETKPSFKKGVTHQVCLLQLATSEICFLFRLHLIPFHPKLSAILSNPKITKVGVSIKDDIRILNKRGKFKPQGFIDMQNMAKEVGIKDISLQKIYAILFGKRISKTQRLSNWESEVLTPAQQQYAAIDAWACIDIYHQLQKEISLK